MNVPGFCNWFLNIEKPLYNTILLEFFPMLSCFISSVSSVILYFPWIKDNFFEVVFQLYANSIVIVVADSGANIVAT